MLRNGLRCIIQCSSHQWRVNSALLLRPVLRRHSSDAVKLESIRNVAIIAHVDHGKTTMVDQLLQQSGTMDVKVDRVMDSNVLEKERGITIFSKCAGLNYKQPDGSMIRVNLVDTPGHADFGGEVERVLSMVDGVVLLVDAMDGPMAQTKYVLEKALKRDLRAIVVINKVDRGVDRLEDIELSIMDLFSELGAKQLDYPTLYASAKQGWAVTTTNDIADGPKGSMKPLLDALVTHVPHPKADRTAPFRMLVTQLEANNFLGKCVIGRILSGRIVVGDPVKALATDNTVKTEARVLKLFSRHGLDQISVNDAEAGDIVSLAGLPSATVNDTICAPEITTALAATAIDPPTIAISISINSSPLAGLEGTQLTSNVIFRRLFHECDSNVSLQVEQLSSDTIEARGRGELQLSILVEQMRREGFEVSLSSPRVLFQKNEAGEVLEPIEEVTLDVDSDSSGMVVEKLSRRKGEMTFFDEIGKGRVRLRFLIPTRGLIGYPREFKHDTRGTGVLQQRFVEYSKHRGPIETTRKGALISMASGECTAYALEAIEPRGKLFVTPGTKVYSGMVIGEHSKDDDLEVNPVKLKHLTNMRSVQKEEFVRLTPPIIFTLESAMSYIQNDELIEVTGKSIRLRKRELDSTKRKSDSRRKRYD